MSREILGNGLKAFHETDRDVYAEVFVRGPSSRPNDPYAKDAVVEISIGHVIDGAAVFLVPLDEVRKMIWQAEKE